MQVGVAGASGYVGAELLRICAGHPNLDVCVATAERRRGTAVAAHSPSLAAAYPTLCFEATEPASFAGCELVFVALPHGRSQKLVASLVGQGTRVVDLGADFRLKDHTVYEAWYGEAHLATELLPTAIYGLVERHRAELAGASLVAVPGCYPTATALALGPFIDGGAVASDPVVVDALSGASGAGREPSDRLHFSTLYDDVAAYGLVGHRHTAEMQAELGATVLFTPHLVPMDRGMLVTAYARVAGECDTDGAMAILEAAYRTERFVVVTDDAPTPKALRGTNVAHVTARVDPRTGWLIALCAIDNLGKGAAGQAVQAANVVLGLDEGAGLAIAGVWP